MKHLKRYLLALLLCLLLLPACTATAYAEKVYIITETELTRLEYNLSRLEQLSMESQKDLLALKEQLTKSREKSITLQEQLTDLKHTSKVQEKLLANANKSLQEYANEEHRAQCRIRRQRTLAWSLFGCALLTKLIK